MNIVFFGTPRFAVPTLQQLLDSQHTVAGVVTQPDRPRGRGQKVTYAPVKALASDLYNAERRAELGRSIDALVMRVRELSAAREAALFLAGDVDLAWRLFSLALLAEELAD